MEDAGASESQKLKNEISSVFNLSKVAIQTNLQILKGIDAVHKELIKGADNFAKGIFNKMRENVMK
jgi:hypothetical protein